MSSLKPSPFPRPDFPEPEVSKLAERIAHAAFHSGHLSRGQWRVRTIFKGGYYGTVLFAGPEVIAILFNQAREEQYAYLFLIEPRVYAFNSKVILDRFNALLLKARLPTLHFITEGCWIFRDGTPWFGQRALRFKEWIRTVKSEKEILKEIYGPPSRF